MNLADHMQGCWRDCLIKAGIEPRALTGKHTACPLCGGEDRFRYDDKDGRGTYFCNGCGAGDGIKLMLNFTGMKYLDLYKQLTPHTFSKTARPKVTDHTALIERIRKSLQPVTSDCIVAQYLAKRGMTRLDYRFIRFCPDAYQWVDKVRMPAMVVALRDHTGTVQGYHLTYINPDLTKHSTLYTPGETGDCALPLCKTSQNIAIAEGIETAMSVSELERYGCWATGDAGRMEKFVPPEGTKGVIIFADNDTNYRGQKAAYTLANRLVMAGLEVVVKVPPVAGEDWNDVLVRLGRSA